MINFGAMKLNVWEKFWIGVKAYINAITFVFENGLWIYFIYPIIISVLMFFGGYALIQMLSDLIEAWVMGYFTSEKDGWLSYVTGIFSFFINIGLKIIFWYIYSTFNKYILLIIMSPIMALISERTEEIITGKKFPFQLDQFIRDVFRGILIALRNMLIEYGFIIASFVVVWIPVIGWFSTIFLWFVSWYFYGFSMIDYTNERRRLNVTQSVSYIRKNKSLAIGNGLIFALIFRIPFIGGVLATVISPVAATIAVLDLEKKIGSSNG